MKETHLCTRTHTHTRAPWGCVEDRQQGSGGTTLFEPRLFWAAWPRGRGRMDIGEKEGQSLYTAFVQVAVCDVFLRYISVYVRPVFLPVPLGGNWRMFSVVSVVGPCVCCVCTFYMCASSLTPWTHAGGLVMPHSCQSAWSPPTVTLGGPACNRAYSQFTSDRDNDTYTHNVHVGS